MPLVVEPFAGARLARFNPAAKLGAAALVMVGLLVTVDLVTASVLLVCELLAVAAAGVPVRGLMARAWPLPVAAAGVAVANLVASNAGAVTTAAISVRLMAIALPGLLVFGSTDAVDLTDSLVQQLRVPPRFAYGALAALRLLPLLSAEWDTIHRARRARGIDAGRSPVRKARLFASSLYALLVGAIRRGARLAMAMDSRGFDSHRPRTIARHQQVRMADWALLAVVAATVGAANGLAVMVGAWHPLLG